MCKTRFCLCGRSACCPVCGSETSYTGQAQCSRQPTCRRWSRLETKPAWWSRNVCEKPMVCHRKRRATHPRLSGTLLVWKPARHVRRHDEFGFLPAQRQVDLPFFADESLDSIEKRAKHLYEKTELAVVANLQLHLLAAGQSLRGYENFMIDFIINKKMVHSLFERLIDAYIRRCENYFNHEQTIYR